MFKFLFPRRAEQIAALLKEHANLLTRFDELYAHLDIHRSYNHGTSAKYELKAGKAPDSFLYQPFSFAGDWNWTTSNTTTEITPITPTPAKKTPKRKKRKPATVGY